MMSIFEFLILDGFILIVNQILDLRYLYTHLCMWEEVKYLDFIVLLGTLYLMSYYKQVLTKKCLDIQMDYTHNTDSESVLFL